MNNPLLNGLIPVAALLIGAFLGFLFGAIQNSALIRNKKRNAEGKLKSPFHVMPGSFSRIAVLLVVLVVVQAGMPMFFKGNIQWLVSVGLILGYGWTMLKRIKNRSVYRT